MKKYKTEIGIILAGVLILGMCIGALIRQPEVDKLRAEVAALNLIEVVIEEQEVAESVAEITTEETTTDCAVDYLTWDEYTATGYCACSTCCGKWSETQGEVIKGAHGIPLEEGKTVACNYFPAGTKIEIQGYGIYTVADTGAMKGKVIDFYFENHEDAEKFGRQTVYIREVK